jgi:hypothetical protein
VSKSVETRISLQIALATTEERMKEESLQTKLRRRVSQSLMAKGLRDVYVWLEVSRPPQSSELVRWHDQIVDMVLQHYDHEEREVRISLPEAPNWDDTIFHQLHIYNKALAPKFKERVIVGLGILSELLAPEITVQQAIDRKIESRYSDSKDLWLLLCPGRDCRGENSGSRSIRTGT